MDSNDFNNSKRRHISAVLFAIVSSPLVSLASAQSPAKVCRIGVLYPGPEGTPLFTGYTAFLEGIKELGYIEGRNLALHRQYTDPSDSQRTTEQTAKLVAQKIDLIVTNGTSTIRAAQKVTTKVPIIGLTFADPVRSGLAKSLARPGGNVTGTSIVSDELDTKRFEILSEAVPRPGRIALLTNPDNPVLKSQVAAVRDVALKANRDLIVVSASGERDLPAVSTLLDRERVRGLQVSADTAIHHMRESIASLALKHKLPCIFHNETAADLTLFTYGPDFVQLGRRAAALADKICRGASPSDLPIEQPTHFILTVNLRIARTLGVTIPSTIMVRADRVIER